MLMIDVHTHFLPPELVDEARAGGAPDGLRTELAGGQEWMVHRQGFRYPLHRTFYDMSARLDAMTAMGIDVGILSVAPTIFMYWLPAAEGRDFCRRTNDTLATLAKESDGRLCPVATLPMQDPAAAAHELRRAVGQLGLHGAEIGPSVEGEPLDDVALRPVLTAASDLGVPLIVHPSSVSVRPGLPDFYLTNLVGNPLETTICAARLIFSGTLDALPGLRIVLMHGGGYLPYQIGRLDHGHRVRPEAAGCRDLPSSYLGRFHYDTITHAARPLEFLVDLVGADHVVYGTDYPFDMGGGSLEAQLAGVELSADDREAIAGGNAAALFGVGGKPVGGKPVGGRP
jgi:aminocarboxymuconate-semialdehyde decarboxylase